MAPRQSRAVQPRVRARRVWRGHGRGHARPPQPRHRRQGDHRPGEPGAPRCPGRRTAHRRRCRHPAAGPRRVPARRRRIRPARRRAATPPASRSCRSPPRTPPRRARPSEKIAEAEGLEVLGWRDVPTDESSLGALARDAMPTFRQVFIAGASGHGSRAPRLRGAQARRARARHQGPRPGRPRPRNRLLPKPFRSDVRLQGHADHAAAQGVLPRPAGRSADQRAGHRALAVLHEHVPVVAAGAPVPADRPQRRDQHRHRQRELDAGARGADQHRRLRLRQDLDKIVPGLHARRVRHRALRRGARAAAPRRPQPAARRADDDPGGVGAPRVDGPGAPGVLPVPRVADGAVGRPGVDDVHRRHRDRRGAGPQRPSPVAHLGHRATVWW